MRIKVQEPGLYSLNNEYVSLQAGDEVEVLKGNSCVLISEDLAKAKAILGDAVKSAKDELTELSAACALARAAETLLGKVDPPESLAGLCEAASGAAMKYADALNEEIEKLADGRSAFFAGDPDASPDHTCAECGGEFDSNETEPYYGSEKPDAEIIMLLSASGAHAGYVFKGDGPDGEPEVVCESCGSDRLEAN